MKPILPVADAAEVRRYVGTLLRRHRGALLGVLALHLMATATGLVAPQLLGRLVEAVRNGATQTTVDTVALLIGGFVLAQTAFTRYASLASIRFGERVLAELREEFVDRVLALPLSVVERAGSGDLLTRSSRDVGALGSAVRYAVPEIVIGLTGTVLTVGAMLITAPVLAVCCLAVLPPLVLTARWYLRRAPEGYLRESAAYADINEGLAETVDGARTVEALRLAAHRIQRTDDDIRRSYIAERYTLWLRTVFFTVLEASYFLPVVAALLVGGVLYIHDMVSLAQVTAVTLYSQQLVEPVSRLVLWLDELQMGAASLARVLGVAQVPDDRTPSDRRPRSTLLEARDVHYAYRDGHDVLHGVTLRLRPGERLAMVGPSGAGKSTLGRLLAGIHAPRRGSVTIDEVALMELPLDELRGQVALVTQEHHVFVGTLRDNLVLARPDASEAQIWEALEAVDARDWAAGLPDGLDTRVGSGGHTLTPAQAQQVALARLVLANPHTLVLDEATSLLDPRAARHLERSLAAVLKGRTVVAIAHRLHTAHDADRVAVVADGRIVELGSHDELVAAGGAYAALWDSWHGAPHPERV